MSCVEREIEVAAGPEEVWELLATEEGLARWLADEVELDAEPGGRAVFRYADGEERRGVVEAVEDGVRLALRWRRAGEASESRVELTVVADALDAERSRLRVVESQLAPVAVPRARAAWGACLAALSAGLRVPCLA